MVTAELQDGFQFPKKVSLSIDITATKMTSAWRERGSVSSIKDDNTMIIIIIDDMTISKMIITICGYN